MHVDCALVDLGGLPPDAVEHLGPGEHSARLLEQKFEQPEFGWTKRNIALAPPNTPRVAVEIDIAGAEAVRDTLRAVPGVSGLEICRRLWARESSLTMASCRRSR
jgi:hypothetical protein